MAKVTEIGPELYRISVYVPDFDLQFNHFLVNDEEPLLFHTGYKAWFSEVHEATATVVDPSRIRWIGFSHFESDECGSLNQWLEVAPSAEAVCSVVGALVSVNDFAIRPAKGMAEGEVLRTGTCRFRLCRTPHLPHGWDASALFEETSNTLLCSDLFHQVGDVEPLTQSDVVGRTREALKEYQAGILADYSPYTHYTGQLFEKLAALKPERLAIMHGSSFEGNGERALDDLAVVFRETFGGG
ncbi:MBL fold metallo-hydrolase [Acidobacteria bacterium AH-259-O06]|nr:MBL fold metallo-hydrolase [Acidobacteria bacterium AH-259-O06]